MGMGEFVELAGLVGSVTRYYNAAANQHNAGVAALIVAAACFVGLTVGMLLKWSRETR